MPKGSGPRNQAGVCGTAGMTKPALQAQKMGALPGSLVSPFTLFPPACQGRCMPMLPSALPASLDAVTKPAEGHGLGRSHPATHKG